MIIFKSSKDDAEEEEMFLKCESVLVMVGEFTNNIIRYIFTSFLKDIKKR